MKKNIVRSNNYNRDIYSNGVFSFMYYNYKVEGFNDDPRKTINALLRDYRRWRQTK